MARPPGFLLLLFVLLAAAAAVASATAAGAAAASVTTAAATEEEGLARPLPGCAAVLSAAVAPADLLEQNSTSSPSPSSYSRTLLANGDFLLESPWQTWPCMSGVRARGFLTLRPAGGRARGSSGSGNSISGSRGSDSSNSSSFDDGDDTDDLLVPLSCSTVEAGLEIDDAAFDAARLPSVPQVDACKPRFCAGREGGEKGSGFESSNNTERCEQPSLKAYLDSPASASAFSPFAVIQLDYEPLGHAPHGVYSDPHFDFHFYYTAKEEVEAIEKGTCGVGLLSPESFKKALAPVPLQCFPTGAWANVGLAVNGMGNHIVNLLSPEFNRFPARGFGQTMIFVEFCEKICCCFFVFGVFAFLASFFLTSRSSLLFLFFFKTNKKQINRRVPTTAGSTSSS